MAHSADKIVTLVRSRTHQKTVTIEQVDTKYSHYAMTIIKIYVSSSSSSSRSWSTLEIKRNEIRNLPQYNDKVHQPVRGCTA